MKRRCGVVLILLILLFSVVCLATPSTERATPAPHELVDQVVASLGFDSVGCRREQITKHDADLINLLFSYSCAQSILSHTPISSWEQLHDITYVIASSERPACQENQALMLRLLFDLSGTWPWPNEAIITGLVPGTGNAASVITGVIESRGIDDHGCQDRVLDSGDREALDLFFTESDQASLYSHMPITSWEGLYAALPITMSDLKAAILHIVYDLSGEWPWLESREVTVFSYPPTSPKLPPSLEPDLWVSWEYRWDGTSSSGVYVSIEITIENKGNAPSTGTICWFGMEESLNWFYDQTDFRERDIPAGGSRWYKDTLWVPFEVWTRLIIIIRNDQGADIREESRDFYTG